MGNHGEGKGLPLLLIAALAGLVACGGGAGKRKVECEYAYGKEAIRVRLAATPQLNTFNDQPHTVVVVLYQLSDPNMFEQLLETEKGVTRLLGEDSFDGSVLSRRMLVVQPGEWKEIEMDRVPRSRYLAVVAGFYDRRAQEFSRLFPIPTRKVRSFLGKEKACYAEPLSVELTLGADGFVEVE